MDMKLTGRKTTPYKRRFCKTVRKLVLSRAIAKVTAVLAASLLVYLQVMDTWSVLLAVLLPFLIWMAS